MPKKHQAGCGCCCVNLVVDDDNESKWDRVTDTGIETITILQAVDLCNFYFRVKVDQPAKTGSGYYGADFDGTLTIYFLTDPSEDNVDAIGSITLTNHNAHDTTTPFARQAGSPLPFYRSGEVIGETEQGDGVIDIPDMGFSAVAYDHDGFPAIDLRIYSFDDVFALGGPTAALTQGIFYSGTATVAGLDSYGQTLVLERTMCTDSKVFVRYVVESDFDIDTIGVFFELKTLNEVGDISCRTEADPYAPETEEGSCTSPPTFCDILRYFNQPFATVHFDVTGVPNVPDVDTTLWTIPQSDYCEAETRVDATAAGGFGNFGYYKATIALSCDTGTPVMRVGFHYAVDNVGPGEEAYWEIELSTDIEHPNEIGTYVLNSANAVSYTFSYTAELTINA